MTYWLEDIKDFKVRNVKLYLYFECSLHPDEKNKVDLTINYDFFFVYIHKIFVQWDEFQSTKIYFDFILV